MDISHLSDSSLSEKERKILESAISIFSEKGFSGATTSEIAKNAGVAEGTIFRYFKTKKDILRSILIQTINIVSDKLVLGAVEKIFLSDDKDLRTVLKELLYDRLKLLDSIFPMARIVITEALYHEDVREAIYSNIITKAMDIFTDFHQRMAEKGIMRNDIDSQTLARTIVGNIGMLIAQKKLFGDKFEIQNSDNEFDKIIDVIMYGVAKVPDKDC